MLTEKTFDTGELMLNYAEGPKNGAALVLLHGATLWWHEWDPMIPRLEPDWHLYAVDLRGHGQSGRDGDHYYVPDYARDVIALLRQIGEPAVLVGHSLGALTSMTVAAEAPELLRTVVLVDPPIGLALDIDQQPETKDWFIMARQITTAAPTYEAMLALMAERRKGRDDARTESMARMLSGLAPQVMDATLSNRLFGDLDRADMLEHIHCPVLLLVADWDKGGAMRPQDVEFIRAHVRNLTVYNFPDADHQLPTNKPDELVDQIQSFLPSA